MAIKLTPKAYKHKVISLAGKLIDGPEAVDWFLKNWPVWLEFVHRADELRKKGRTRYSAMGLVHVVRYHRHLKTETSDQFMIPNHWAGRMGRVYNKLIGKQFFEERGPDVWK